MRLPLLGPGTSQPLTPQLWVPTHDGGEHAIDLTATCAPNLQYFIHTTVGVTSEQISSSREALGWETDEEVIREMRSEAARRGLVLEPSLHDPDYDFLIRFSARVDPAWSMTAAYEYFLDSTHIADLDGPTSLPAPFLDHMI